MSNKKQKTIQRRSVEYSKFRLFRLLGFIQYALYAVILIGVFWFLYTKMYQTIGQVESLTTLSPMASSDSLDTKTFEEVERLLSIREERPTVTLVRDPFTPSDMYSRLTIIQSTTSSIEVVMLGSPI